MERNRKERREEGKWMKSNESKRRERGMGKRKMGGRNGEEQGRERGGGEKESQVKSGFIYTASIHNISQGTFLEDHKLYYRFFYGKPTIPTEQAGRKERGREKRKSQRQTRPGERERREELMGREGQGEDESGGVGGRRERGEDKK